MVTEKRLKIMPKTGLIIVVMVLLASPYAPHFFLRSSEWRGLSDSEKRKLNLNFADDGEFW